jgi:hypothetical protein
MAVPLMKSEAGLAGKTAMPAMSSGTPQRLAGVRASTPSWSPGTSARALRVKWVSIQPGRTDFLSENRCPLFREML